MNLHVEPCPFVRVDYVNRAGVKFVTDVDPRGDDVYTEMTPTNGPSTGVILRFGGTNVVIELRTSHGNTEWAIDANGRIGPGNVADGPFAVP